MSYYHFVFGPNSVFFASLYLLLEVNLEGLLLDVTQGYFIALGYQSMLQRWFQESQTQFWDSERTDSEDSGSSFGRLPYQLWNVSKYGSCADAAITGIMPPPLMELQVITCICL